MRITDIRTTRLAGPDPHGLGAPRTWTVMLVRVDTDEGLYGLGEASEILGCREAIEFIRSQLVGRDPLAVRPLVTEILYGRHPPAEPSMSHTAVSTGPIAWGMAGVEIALLDLAGKALGTPVYNLFGGAYRDRIRVYLDRSAAHDVEDLDAWAQLGLDAKERGFTDVKFDVEYTAPDRTADVWNRTLAPDQIAAIVERLGAVRSAVGPELEISVDCHMHYTAPTAIRLARELEPLGLKWLEDPTPITNPDALADVRAQSPIPICIGEMLVPEQLRIFVDRGACDVVHPDVCFAGGLHETRKIADYADLHYLPLALHNNGCGLGTIAAAHVAAASPNFIGLEYHFHDAPWIGHVVERSGRPLFEDGHVVLTDDPGLGCELDEDVCRRYLVDGETLF